MSTRPDRASRLLHDGAAALGLQLTPAQQAKLLRFLDLLVDANERFNLTSLRDRDAMLRRHLLESLALGVCLAQRGLLAETTKLIDLGSGGGLPGLPIKLVWTEIELTLLEVTSKKAQFLEHACVELGSESTRVLCERAETLAHDPGERERFEVATARAVATLPALVELALPFLARGGVLAAVKGSQAGEEIAAADTALRLCGGRLVAQEALPAEQAQTVVLIEKIAPTPPNYPRRPGRPASRPLR